MRALAGLVDDVVLALEGRVPRVEDRLERRVVAALPRLHGRERVLGLGRGAPPAERRARALRRQVREVDPVRVPVRRVVPDLGVAHLAQDAVDEFIFKVAVADGLARQVRRDGRVADLRRHDLGGPQLRVRPVDGRGPVGEVRRHEAHVVDLVVAHQQLLEQHADLLPRLLEELVAGLDPDDAGLARLQGPVDRRARVPLLRGVRPRLRVRRLHEHALGRVHGDAGQI